MDGKLEGPGGRGREIAVAAAILAAVLACCFWMLVLHPADLLVGPQPDGNGDLAQFFWPLHSVPRLSLAWYGEYALWNPYLGTGTPRYGSPHSACWYAPNWILLLCDTAPALCWLMVAHQWWAGLGTYLLCRRWGLGFTGSVVGGTLFLAAPYGIGQIGEGHYAQICVISWVPWVWLAYERFRARPADGWMWVVLTLAVCAVAGHAQEACYLALALTLLALVDAWQELRSTRGEAAAQVLTYWFTVVALTALMVAAEALPAWTYGQQAWRGSGSEADSLTAGGLELGNLWQLFNGAALGDPESSQAAGQAGLSPLCYFGVVPLALAMIGALTQWHRYPVPRSIGLGLLALAFAFGRENVVCGFLHKFVPGLASLGDPSRALFLCAFAVAVLAAAGSEFLVGMVRGQEVANRAWWQRRLAIATAICVALLLLTWAIGTFCPDWLPAGPMAASVGRWPTWAWLAATLGLLTLMIGGRKEAGLGLAGLLALGGLELALYADGVLRAAPRAMVRQDSPVVQFLRQRVGYQRVLAEQSLLSDREAIENGIFKVQSNQPAPLVCHSFAMHALNNLRDPTALLTGLEPLDVGGLNPAVADMLGVRFAVLSNKVEELPSGWRLVKQGRLPAEITLRGRTAARTEYFIYENATALPRCFVVGKPRILQDTDVAAQVLATVEPGRRVLVGRDLLGDGPRTDFQPAEIVEYTPNRVVMDVTLRRPGYLVLSDAWYPGWTATDNGRPTVVMPANVAGRAVPLGPGAHRVVFQCGWSRYFGGILLSSLALALVVLQIRRRSHVGDEG